MCCEPTRVLPQVELGGRSTVCEELLSLEGFSVKEVSLVYQLLCLIVVALNKNAVNLLLHVDGFV